MNVFGITIDLSNNEYQDEHDETFFILSIVKNFFVIRLAVCPKNILLSFSRIR